MVSKEQSQPSQSFLGRQVEKGAVTLTEEGVLAVAASFFPPFWGGLAFLAGTVAILDHNYIKNK